MKLPLARLHALLTDTASPGIDHGAGQGAGLDRPGILLTGVTGFLGGHVLAAALARLPQDQVVYCLIRPRNLDPQARLDRIARALDLDRSRLVAVGGSIDAPQFGLDAAAHAALCERTRSVVHCAATVNLAVDRVHMETWSRAGIQTVLNFCRAAGADLSFFRRPRRFSRKPAGPSRKRWRRSIPAARAMVPPRSRPRR